LTGGLVTQKPIILKSTVPDFCWPVKHKIVYLDGKQVHSSDKAERRDEEIDNLLELQGWDVLRNCLRSAVIKAGLQRVVVQIKDFLGEVS